MVLQSYVDAYWNSRAQGFASHLFQLMTAWAVVCDVWYLDPMAKRENETASQFAKRVQKAIGTTRHFGIISMTTTQ